jgi:hypothetical protein
MVTESTARRRMDHAAASIPPYPGGFEGRGIVIPAGGVKYFPCAWVCIRMLRQLGCTLPVELWHLGPGEISDAIRRLLDPMDVRCVDARDVRERHPARILNGWELKPYAILHSRFREVLMLDADNVPAADPEYLFDAPEYRRHGAVLWPDLERTAPECAVWRLTGVPYRDEPDVESGQVLVDKRACWRPLRLTMWMNEFSDFWYRHVYGDKETFRFAWHKLGAEFAMPSRGIEYLPGVLCQHDFDGRRVFQHRYRTKWTLRGPQARVPGFVFEEDCLRHLQALQEQWDG